MVSNITFCAVFVRRFLILTSTTLLRYWPIEAEYGKCKFPGLKSTKVDMTSFNQDKSVLDRRQLQWYRVIGDMPDVHADPNLHAAAHLYASDRNGLFVVSDA